MIQIEQFPNGTFTLEGSGVHLTLSVKTARKGHFEGKRIISIMVGSDNESDFLGIANLELNGSLRVWRKAENCRRNPATGEYLTAKQVESVIRLIMEHGRVGEVNGAEVFKEFECNGRSYKLMTSVRCCRCNRKLTNPESVQAGIGPECAGK